MVENLQEERHLPDVLEKMGCRNARDLHLRQNRARSCLPGVVGRRQPRASVEVDCRSLWQRLFDILLILLRNACFESQFPLAIGSIGL